MNKKIFAALASATMALSATGSLAVFAEDFDTVDEANSNNGTIGGITLPGNKITVNETNFPDDGFRQMIIKGEITGLAPTDYGKDLTKSDVENVTAISLKSDVVNPEGLQFFTGLTDLTVYSTTADNELETLDLSANKKLKTLKLANVSELETLVLPETNTLSEVLINATGNGLMTTAADGSSVINYDGCNAANFFKPASSAPITEIDFSGSKGLTKVQVNGTDVMKIDLSDNPYLTDVNVAGNKLFSLDLTDNFALVNVACYGNNLYSLDVPDTNRTEFLNASYNILQEIDLTGLTGVKTLYLGNNELKDVDLSPIPDTAKVTLYYNHIGALDDQGVANVNATPQIVYVDASFNGVNLKDAFDGFEVSAVTAGNVKKNGNLELNSTTTNYTYNTGKNSMDVVVVNNVRVLNRLYNPNSGEHFYTSDVEEKDALVKLGWHDEGTGWVSPKESKKPVYRLYNPNAGDHHYTTSSSERDILVSVGWKNEGTGWYSYVNPNEYVVNTKNIESVDVVREYNPNAKAAGAHNYTINRAENDFLVSVGWLDEGVAWQSLK